MGVRPVRNGIAQVAGAREGMTRPILKTEASAEERANYLEAGLETKAGLEEAIRLLNLQHGRSSDPEKLLLKWNRHKARPLSA